MTRQAIDKEWPAVEGAPTREMDLHPPAGQDWSLHSFVHSPTQVVAVWSREKRHGMSDVYAHSEAVPDAQAPVKTIADMPVPK